MADQNPFADLIPQRTDNPFADLIPAMPNPQLTPGQGGAPARLTMTMDDHGLARRQAMSPVEKALSPFTEAPRHYKEIREEAQHQMSTGVGQLANSITGHGLAGDVPEFVSGLGNTALGALGYVGSPISAAYRSVVGQPIEDVTGIPREYTETVAQLATPGLGFTRSPVPVNVPGYRPVPGTTGPGAPVNPGNYQPGSVGPAEPPPVPGAGPSGQEAALAMQRLREAGHDVDVPRVITTDSVSMQRAGQGMSNTPIIGDPIAKALHERVPGQILAARDRIAAEHGGATAENAAGRAADLIAERAAAETRAGTEAAATSDAAVLGAHERAIAEANARIAQGETQSLERTRAAVGDMNPQDMGQALITRLRTGEQEAQAVKNQLYREADSSDAVINADAVRNIRDHVNQAVTRGNVGVYEGTSPRAAEMLGVLDKFAEFQSPTNLVAPRPAVAAPARGIGDNKGPALKPAAPTPTAPQGQSLTEFLAGKLGPDAELSAIGADRHLVNIEGTGRRRLVRQGGWDLDTAREAAEEAGYLRGDHKGTSTVNDLLDALDAEMRGNKRFAEGQEGSVSSKEAAAASERARAELSNFRRGLEGSLADAGHGQLGPQVKQRTLKIMEDERLGPDEAVEKALRQLDSEEGASRGKAPGAEFPGDRPRLTSGPAGPDASGGVTIQRVDEMRKYLRGIAQKAETPTDERAAAAIMRAFESWETNAFDNALVSGSPEGLSVVRRARAANRDLMERFGYNAAPGVEGAADRLLNRIATGEVTPNEVAEWLIGTSSIGAKGQSTRLLERITEATGGDAEALQAIRGGVWNRLSQSTPEEINAFLTGSGRALAERLYTPEQRQIIASHAATVARSGPVRELVGEIAKNTKPGKMDVAKGPLQQIADSFVGGKLGKDEALWKTIEGYIKPGGDSAALARLVGQLPREMRGDIAGSVISGLGKNQSGNFSLDYFASDWGKVTPRAKAILFDEAHVKALDDLATIAERLKNVKKKYGNSSGTAQSSGFQKLMAVVASVAGGTGSGVVTPGQAAYAIGAGAGSYVGARILAKPAGAASIAKYARALERAEQSPGPASQAMVSMTERNLVNTIKTLGATRAPPSGQGMRLLQGPVPAGAENEQR